VSKLRPLPVVEEPGQPFVDAASEQPPLIRRAEVVAIALVGLLLIAIVGVLYVAKVFFLPIVTGFVVGTMLAPAAAFLHRFRIPRAVSAVLIVAAACALVGVMVGLITAPIMDWMARLPELGATLKEKLHVFDRPLALWHQFQVMLGGPNEEPPPMKLPKIDWMQPTLEFLSPTFTEFVLFVVTLILFIVSWPNLRRALVMNFAEHDARLRTLKILNEIEASLGSYLMTVTAINFGVGIATGLIAAGAGMPNPAGLGALAAVLNFFPIVGPIAMFVVLVVVGAIAFPTLAAGMLGPAGFVFMTFIEGHFVTPAIIGRRLQLNALAVFLALAFWTWLWGPMGGFLACPLLIVGLVLKERLFPIRTPQLPTA
jgi:predicted PurR-regulated permease PerM